jgi:hypothetical protein
MIIDPIVDAFAALDQSYWSMTYHGTVIAQGPDLSLTILTDDGTTIPNVQWQGGTGQVLPAGDVSYRFDRNATAWAVGSQTQGAAADFMVLGTQLLAAINLLIDGFNTHAHTNSAGITGTPQTLAAIAMKIPEVATSVLSTTVKVQP